MSKLNNTVKTNYQTTSHKNFMNGNSWDISDNFKKLLIVGASSFFGEPKYYNNDGSINNKYITSEIEEEVYSYIEKSLGKSIICPCPSDCDGTSWQVKIEKIIDDEMKKIDGYKKCNLYVEGYRKNGISKALNIVLMFNYLYELANEMDNSMDDISFILYSSLSKDFYIINTYILWK